jgi:hypothetical protein
VLQEGEFHRVGGEQIIRVSVRVISATNRDLAAMVTQEKFREDLYYRLSVVPIRVPALRERPHDIRLLAEYFLEDFCSRNNFRRKMLDETVFALLEDLRLAGQRARIAQRDRAHGHPHAGRPADARRHPGGDPRAARGRSEIDHSGSARIGRAGAHSARAGGIQLERLGRRAHAGDGADESAQAHSRAGAGKREVDEPRYRIPDISVKALPHEITPILTRPDLAIEIVSPDDEVGEMLTKIGDYLAAGIPYIWVVDPYKRTS